MSIQDLKNYTMDLVVRMPEALEEEINLIINLGDDGLAQEAIDKIDAYLAEEARKEVRAMALAVEAEAKANLAKAFAEFNARRRVQAPAPATIKAPSVQEEAEASFKGLKEGLVEPAPGQRKGQAVLTARALRRRARKAG